MFLSACGVSEQVFVINGSSMGTTYTVKTLGEPVSKQSIDNVLEQVNQTFSTWIDTSELSSLNKKPVDQYLDVSKELFFVLSQSKKIHKDTFGYFDPGIGRLIDLWGFGAKEVDVKPSRSQVEVVLPQTSIQYLQLKEGRVKKTKDIHINLSAIAKGFSVDQVAKTLSEKGIQNFLVEIGGEVATRGKNNNKDWIVGIEQPNNTLPISINLSNRSIATSGNYRNFFVWEGETYMHILNPTSGLPAKSDLSSVSVIHGQTAVADAYATAMMAMGSSKAEALARELNLSVILILNRYSDFKVVKINL